MSDTTSRRFYTDARGNDYFLVVHAEMRQSHVPCVVLQRQKDSKCIVVMRDEFQRDYAEMVK